MARKDKMRKDPVCSPGTGGSEKIYVRKIARAIWWTITAIKKVSVYIFEKLKIAVKYIYTKVKNG